MSGADKSLTTLAQIKQHEERAAAERLNAARQRLDRERNNLTMVQQYLSEYGNGKVKDTDSRSFADGQRFRLQLERSLEAQQSAVEAAQNHAEQARSHWAQARAEREAMEKLLGRRSAARTQRQLNGEQHQTDEQAQRTNGKNGSS